MLSRPKAEVPAGTRGRLGGFLSRRTRMPPVRAAADRREVPPERARTNREKRTIRRGGIAGRTQTARSMERIGRLPLKKSQCQCRCAEWVNEMAGTLP